jgi:hypothetical protein
MWELFPGTPSLPSQSNKRKQYTEYVTTHWLHNITHCVRGAGCFAPGLPNWWFPNRLDQCHKGSPLCSSRMGPVARIGLSLAWDGCRLRGSHSRVNSPGLILRFPPACSTARSVANSTTSSGLRPVPAASTFATRCRKLFQAWRLASSFPLPFRAFIPFRIKAFREDPSPPARLPFRPISLRSPKPLLFDQLAQDHRSRFVLVRAHGLSGIRFSRS